jgi:hypothetical protein
MLGAHVKGGRVHVAPHVPKEFGRIKLTRVKLLGALWDVEAIGSKGDIRLSA